MCVIALCAVLLPRAAQAQIAGTVSLQPFTNITGEPGDAWIGVGIAETLIADLHRAPGIEIVTGERIGVRWVLRGAYQRVGNQIRITARLVEIAQCGRRDTHGVSSTAAMDVSVQPSGSSGRRSGGTIWGAGTSGGPETQPAMLS